MDDEALANLSEEHRDFYRRFQSFWAAPSGERVAELIAPDASIHFTGAGIMTGAVYAGVMGQMLEGMKTNNFCASMKNCLIPYFQTNEYK